MGRQHVLKFTMIEVAWLTLHPRIPGWCLNAAIVINGAEVELERLITKGYAAITRDWHNGDEIRPIFQC